MNYPYSTATGTITKILTKIQSVGQPSKVDKKWFSSLGFTKGSEHRMIAILKFLDFAESNGSPTERWSKFRSAKLGKSVLGDAIKSAYSELYNIYPNAHELDKDELTHFFSTRTTAGSLALAHTVNTFKNLAEFASFVAVDNSSQPSQDTDNMEPTKVSNKERSVSMQEKFTKIIDTQNKNITVNLNIQLTVPETTDEKVYDKFFQSMKRHLLS